MPIINYEGQLIQCERGVRLRDAILGGGETPHNGGSRYLNCHGLGTCGTCAVEIVEGDLAPLNARETWRLNFPPHTATKGLRLACQVRVESDLVIKKHAGFWGSR
ncbi:MAG: 2Fe-2S iron-sulfur cluster binding domain-containing protein [Deltaproteobacteria bacterium]|nr:2Fe-2S iron-sulfur cluster binding domain-containing protein [Deltaproteobacteria bacterium]